MMTFTLKLLTPQPKFKRVFEFRYFKPGKPKTKKSFLLSFKRAKVQTEQNQNNKEYWNSFCRSPNISTQSKNFRSHKSGKRLLGLFDWEIEIIKSIKLNEQIEHEENLSDPNSVKFHKIFQMNFAKIVVISVKI